VHVKLSFLRTTSKASAPQWECLARAADQMRDKESADEASADETSADASVDPAANQWLSDPSVAPLRLSAARLAAVRKLTSNHARVLHDVCNPARWTNTDGGALTQLALQRVHVDYAPWVDRALQLVACRLLRCSPSGTEPADAEISSTAPSIESLQVHQLEGHVSRGVVASQMSSQRMSDEHADAWAATYTYLENRLQARSDQKPGRTPDLDVAAAEVMLEVVREVCIGHMTG